MPERELDVKALGPKQAIQTLVRHTGFVQGRTELAMLFLAAYEFMLRVPSEVMRALAYTRKHVAQDSLLHP